MPVRSDVLRDHAPIVTAVLIAELHIRRGDHPVRIPMPAESAIANRTFFSGSAAANALACTLLPSKNDVLRPIRPQRVQSGIQLCIAQDHKDHIVHLHPV